MNGRQIHTKRWTALLLALCICILGIAGSGEAVSAASKTAVKSLKISIGSKNVTKKTYSMNKNKKAALKVSANPVAAEKNAAFKSNNSAVVSVSKRRLTVLKLR